MDSAKLKEAVAQLTKSPAAEETRGKDVSDADVQRLVQETIAAVDVPSDTLRQQTVVCMVGLVGVGKTTVAKAIASQVPIVRVTVDEIRWRMLDQGYNLTRTREIAAYTLTALLEQGHSVIVDADCAGNNKYNMLQTLLEGTDIQQMWIRVTAPEEVVLDRLRQPPSSERSFVGDAAIECYNRRKVFHESFPMTFDVVVDSTKPIEPQIENIVSRLT